MNDPNALRLSPSRTVVTSFNPRQTPAPTSWANYNGSVEESYYDEGDWVLCVAASPAGNGSNGTCNPFIGCALSNGEVQIYDPQRLHNTHSFCQVHDKGAMITDLVRASPHQHAQFQNVLISSGTDGRICCMDLRQQQQSSRAVVQGCLPLGEQALSVSLGYDGYLAAVGSNKAKVHFFDLRQTNQLLGSYVNSHTDEITRVRFQSDGPAAAQWLLTASEDGLACMFDTSQPTEEAALKSVINAQTPIRQVGFFGPNLEGIYCLTGSETISLWSWDSAQCLMDDRAIRATLGVDYLVDASWDAGKQELQLVAGCSNGDTCLATLDAAATSPQSKQPALKATHVMAGGHRGVVRDWCPVSSSVFVTVGEDARLCEWNLMGRQWNAASTKSTAAAITNHNPPMTRRWSGASNKPIHWDNGAGSSGGGPLRRQRNKRTPGPY